MQYIRMQIAQLNKCVPI